MVIFNYFIIQNEKSMATQHVLLVSPFDISLFSCLSLHTFLVARLWSNIGAFLFYWSTGNFLNDPLVHGRLSHHFGQESPRLERVQSIIATQSTEDHWTFRLCTSLCFGLPEIQYSRFNKIYVDHQVDMNDFRKLMTDCMDDWKSSLSSVSWLPQLVQLCTQREFW